jgi:hypothetical protein
VRRVAEGYTNAKGERVEGLGGGFRYCELGEPLFDENGKIRETVSFADLARHVYFTETGEPLLRERVTKSPFIGACRGLGIYLLYNGVLNDKKANGRRGDLTANARAEKIGHSLGTGLRRPVPAFVRFPDVSHGQSIQLDRRLARRGDPVQCGLRTDFG